MTLRQAILAVQKIGFAYDFTIVIVGGAVVRLIGKKTTLKKIDADKKIVFLANAENPTTKREDGKTIVDVDCIAFSNEKDPFTKEVKQKFENLRQELKKLQNQPGFPAVSLEPVLYHPYFPKPNSLTQFVSSIESYHDHDYFFRLGAVKQDVRRNSLAFWTYVFEENDEQIISFNPLAIQHRYNIRGFAAKPKDLEKIWGKSHFALFVEEFDKKTKGVFVSDFVQWDEFAHQLQSAKQSSMQIKRNLWNAYWNTVGTYLAHGTGFIGKLLLPLGNTFFAGK